MEFRLVYSGELLGASRTDTRSTHKHEIRKNFHFQLKRLWEISANLREWYMHDDPGQPVVRTWERHAKRFRFNGVSYVPLNFEELGVGCRIDVLMLRPDQPGQTLIQSGDIDNRLKTLFDALRIPKEAERGEMEGGESPFYCLLEDDSLINHVSVTTDLLLGEKDKNRVQLVLTVNLWPITHTMLNMGVF
jgi:hypothetical protein